LLIGKPAIGADKIHVFAGVVLRAIALIHAVKSAPVIRTASATHIHWLAELAGVLPINFSHAPMNEIITAPESCH
jgi:hypothetical protein